MGNEFEPGDYVHHFGSRRVMFARSGRLSFTKMNDKMKRLLWVACGYLVCLFAIVALFSLVGPDRLFELQQRIRYPDYYSWREGKGEFPGKQFWSGFNTDRHTEQIFLGKSREGIQARLPLLAPVSDEDLSFELHQAQGGSGWAIFGDSRVDVALGV